MRFAYHDTSIIERPDGKQIGINLGWDFTSEHEWGIKELERAFGLQTSELGFEGRKNTFMPDKLQLYKQNTTALVYRPYVSLDSLNAKILNQIGLYFPRGSQAQLIAAWSGNDFGVRARNVHKPLLENLYDAFYTNNGTISLAGRDNPFARNGLVLTDYRLLPVEWKKEARVKDKEHRDDAALRKRIEDDSGVIEKLNDAGKHFLYLGVNEMREGKPRWWLNDGRKCYGWFSTDELLQWANNEGPIAELEKKP